MIHCITTRGLIRVLHLLGRWDDDLRVHRSSGSVLDIPISDIKEVHCLPQTIEPLKRELGDMGREIKFVPRVPPV